jgi:esterase/lipase
MAQVTDFNGLTVGIGSVIFIIVSYAFYIVNDLKKTAKNNKEEFEKDLNEFKGQVKEQNLEIKKDVGEAFSRIRDMETIQAIMKTEHDINHGRRKKDD